MYLGISTEKILLILLIATLVVGPERLPGYAETLKVWVRKGRDLAKSLSSRAKDELGPDFDDVDWRSLDPRQYDPRRIIRSALLDDATPHAPWTPPSPTGSVRPALPTAMRPKPPAAAPDAPKEARPLTPADEAA
ncbi:Sec-independent protein translocase TatB [Microbacterium sp. R86528]|uniref:Sec-independent protein translocase TatB n=1 Tax=Microbacterium sp. R86528 TaxID=3093864 RepID=UPI0037CAD0F4